MSDGRFLWKGSNSKLNNCYLFIEVSIAFESHLQIIDLLLFRPENKSQCFIIISNLEESIIIKSILGFVCLDVGESNIVFAFGDLVVVVELFVGSIEGTVFLIPFCDLFILCLQDNVEFFELGCESADLISRIVAALADLHV